MEEKINKLYKLVIIILIMVSIELLFSLFSVFSVKTTTDDKTQSSASTSTQTTTSNYDVSSFNTLTTKQVVELFNNKKSTYVVYVGRSTCSACVSFVPTLKTLQNKYNYVTQYLDITTVDSNSDEYKTLMDKLDKEVTLTVQNETKTQSFSKYFGYTPMTFIIKNGKFVDGIIGASSESSFETFLNNNGIK